MDAKASRGDLLATVMTILAAHVGDLTALTIHADDVEFFGCFGIDAEGGLPL